MLLVPEDAEDATQEIIIKVLRGLPGFREESALSTWALAIASNHLLAVKSRKMPGLSFEAYEAEVGAFADARGAEISEGERRVLEGELKLSCTLGMLQCLGSLDRLVYILHCFFGVSSAEGGKIAGLSAEAYRKRLCRARARMADFLKTVCGLAGGPACSCGKRLDYALAKGRVSREAPYSALIKRAEGRIEAHIEAMEGLDAAAAVFRAQPPMLPADAEEGIRRILDASEASTLIR
jgi:RNA polymerase sigma factor (sigma-70 family)